MPFNFPIEQNHFGELFAQGISNAINTYQNTKQRKRENTLQDESIAQNKSLFEYEHPGFHFTAPTDVLPVQQQRPAMPSPLEARSFEQPSSFQQAISPALQGNRYRYGNGFYVDQSESDEDTVRKTAAAGAGEFQKALLTAMGTAQGNPSQVNYNNARAAKLNYDVAHPKPLPQDPTAVHAANRLFDVQHPLPTQPPSQFTFPTGTDAQGNPIVLRANTKTGEVERTDVGRPVGGQAGAREAAQLDVAKNQAAQADAQMRKFEDDMLSGKRTISATAAATAKIALTGGAVTSAAAEAALNKLDPDLAMYVRSAKAISVAERLITPRGGSNYLTQTEGMLSGAGPHANADIVNQARQYRQALVGGLQGHGSSAATAAPVGNAIQAKYDAAYQHLKAQGKSDADIKAVIGERP